MILEHRGLVRRNEAGDAEDDGRTSGLGLGYIVCVLQAFMALR